MTDEKAITKPLPSAVAEKDLANYWLLAAMSAESMLQSVLADSDSESLPRQLRGVEAYVRVREKIGAMVEKAVNCAGDAGWDPFAPHPLEKGLEVSAAKSEFAGVASATIALGVSSLAGDLSPAERDSVELYKSGLNLTQVSDRTGLSLKQIRKAMKVCGVKRRRRKKVESASQ